MLILYPSDQNGEWGGEKDGNCSSWSSDCLIVYGVQ